MSGVIVTQQPLHATHTLPCTPRTHSHTTTHTHSHAHHAHTHMHTTCTLLCTPRAHSHAHHAHTPMHTTLTPMDLVAACLHECGGSCAGTAPSPPGHNYFLPCHDWVGGLITCLARPCAPPCAPPCFPPPVLHPASSHIRTYATLLPHRSLPCSAPPPAPDPTKLVSPLILHTLSFPSPPTPPPIRGSVQPCPAPPPPLPPHPSGAVSNVDLPLPPTSPPIRCSIPRYPWCLHPRSCALSRVPCCASPRQRPMRCSLQPARRHHYSKPRAPALDAVYSQEQRRGQEVVV